MLTIPIFDNFVSLLASYEEDCRRYIQTGYYSQCSPTQNIQVAIDGVQRLVTSDHAEESQRITTEDKFAALKLRRRFYQLEKLEHLERTKVNQELLDDKDNLRVHFYKHQDNIPAANDAYSLWRKEEKVALKLEKVEAKNFKFSTSKFLLEVDLFFFRSTNVRIYILPSASN